MRMTLGQDPRFFTAGGAGGVFAHLRAKWGWFVGLGLASTILGVLALGLTVSATLASVLIVGSFMVLIGAAEILIGLRARSWSRVVFWELAGLLYLVAGSFAIFDPVPASFLITLLLGAGLLATGAVRIMLGLQMHGSTPKGPLLLAGVVTGLLGLVIVIGWPGNSLMVLGTLLGIDLIFYGISWLIFGLGLRASR